MKEATGELTTTVITIVAIGALVGFFYLVIWPNLQRGMALSSACSAASGNYYKVDDDKYSIECSNNVCTYTDSNNRTSTRNCEDSNK